MQREQEQRPITVEDFMDEYQDAVSVDARRCPKQFETLVDQIEDGFAPHEINIMNASTRQLFQLGKSLCETEADIGTIELVGVGSLGSPTNGPNAELNWWKPLTKFLHGSKNLCTLSLQTDKNEAFDYTAMNQLVQAFAATAPSQGGKHLCLSGFDLTYLTKSLDHVFQQDFIHSITMSDTKESDTNGREEVSVCFSKAVHLRHVGFLGDSNPIGLKTAVLDGLRTCPNLSSIRLEHLEEQSAQQLAGLMTQNTQLDAVCQVRQIQDAYCWLVLYHGLQKAGYNVSACPKSYAETGTGIRVAAFHDDHDHNITTQQTVEIALHSSLVAANRVSPPDMSGKDSPRRVSCLPLERAIKRQRVELQSMTLLL